MSSDNGDSLQLLFRRVVPVGFIDHLIRRQEWIYEEARQQCYGNPLWTEAEARSLLGDTERALFENEMRKAAATYSLSWENALHNGNNCTYVKVSAGSFRITGHRVVSPGCFVRPSESRRQDAAVNRFMDGYVLEGSLTVPLPKLERAKELAVYILHGATENHEGKRTLFLELAVPDSELENYCWHASLLDVRQGYLADVRKIGPVSVEDKAKPTPKVRRIEIVGNEE